VERVLRIVESLEDAEEIDLDDRLALSGRQRPNMGERMRRRVDFAGCFALLNQCRVEWVA
jgi:hypothetical protein